MRTTGEAREDHREVELDVMVSRPGGGQFPAHETALIPASSMARVAPGSVIDTYYRRGDESGGRRLRAAELTFSVPRRRRR